MIKKRWRDKVDLTEEIRDEIADIRIYLSLLPSVLISRVRSWMIVFNRSLSKLLLNMRLD